MEARSSIASAVAIEKRGTSVHPGAQSCTAIFGNVCKAIWPDKTAEHLAAQSRCGIRTAKYWLSGEREPSAAAVAVIVAAITRRD
ncbi:MAG TPA: hypothetical protein VNQ99_06225 [Xanthobacteraceae bacterium]|nr:hypothetical protein [Xanthobacteraceae bacterium]